MFDLNALHIISHALAGGINQEDPEALASNLDKLRELEGESENLSDLATTTVALLLSCKERSISPFNDYSLERVLADSGHLNQNALSQVVALLAVARMINGGNIARRAHRTRAALEEHMPGLVESYDEHGSINQVLVEAGLQSETPQWAGPLLAMFKLFNHEQAEQSENAPILINDALRVLEEGLLGGNAESLEVARHIIDSGENTEPIVLEIIGGLSKWHKKATSEGKSPQGWREIIAEAALKCVTSGFSTVPPSMPSGLSKMFDVVIDSLNGSPDIDAMRSSYEHVAVHGNSLRHLALMTAFTVVSTYETDGTPNS